MADVLNLPVDWLNTGAVGVLDGRLPDGFMVRLRPRVYGNLVVSVLARMDLLRLKLLAAADEGPYSQHVADVLGMRPTSGELREALRWARGQSAPGTHDFDDIAQAVGVEGRPDGH